MLRVEIGKACILFTNIYGRKCGLLILIDGCRGGHEYRKENPKMVKQKTQKRKEKIMKKRVWHA